MTNFNASEYRITIQKSIIEDRTFYVGAAAEIADLAVYEDSPVKAYKAIIEVLEDLYAASATKGKKFPHPFIRNENEASGRATLRMPKWLHARLDRQSEQENVSLNQHMVSLLTESSSWLIQKLETKNQPVYAIGTVKSLYWTIEKNEAKPMLFLENTLGSKIMKNFVFQVESEVIPNVKIEEPVYVESLH